MNSSSYFSLIQSIIMLVLVILLAYFSLKYANRFMTKYNRIIKIVEKVSVNNNSSLGVVDICGSYYLMSFTVNENKILKELDKEEIEVIIHREIPADMKKRLNNCFGMRGKID